MPAEGGQSMIMTVSEARDPCAKHTAAYFDDEVLPTLAEQHGGTVGTFDYSNLGCAVLTQ